MKTVGKGGKDKKGIVPQKEKRGWKNNRYAGEIWITRRPGLNSS